MFGKNSDEEKVRRRAYNTSLDFVEKQIEDTKMALHSLFEQRKMLQSENVLQGVGTCIEAPLVQMGSTGASSTSSRTYTTGATRSGGRKLQIRRFFSWKALMKFAWYMDKCRDMPDGSLREADNWKKGIPPEDFADSFIRHATKFAQALDVGDSVTAQINAMAAFFNLQGYLHETPDLEQFAGLHEALKKDRAE